MQTTPTWSPAQQTRLDEWRVSRCVDVHCHCLPGLDDGPATIDEAIRLCQALVDDGVTTVVATPHQLGGYDHVNVASRVRQAVVDLAAELALASIPLELSPGGDVRVDERLLRLVESDEVLTVADGRRHLLLELPHNFLVDPLPVIGALEARGIQTVMTHPERHRYLANAESRIASWVDAGAALQITAGSLLGEFGPLANDVAWRLVHAGLASLVATDAHDADRRPPRMTAALAAITEEFGRDAARTLCLENPNRVFVGDRVEPWRAA